MQWACLLLVTVMVYFGKLVVKISLMFTRWQQNQWAGHGSPNSVATHRARRDLHGGAVEGRKQSGAQSPVLPRSPFRSDMGWTRSVLRERLSVCPRHRARECADQFSEAGIPDEGKPVSR
jgi:hypothetical protein